MKRMTWLIDHYQRFETNSQVSKEKRIVTARRRQTAVINGRKMINLVEGASPNIVISTPSENEMTRLYELPYQGRKENARDSRAIRHIITLPLRRTAPQQFMLTTVDVNKLAKCIYIVLNTGT